ncbi:MAG: ribulose-phosphate 3-epimerase [Chitinophagales bacterium]
MNKGALPWVAPSILSANFARLAEEVHRLDGADLLHVDVMDGHFVPNLTIGPGVVAALHAETSLPLDVHLMISNPDLYLDEFAKAGATYLTVHAEACPHLYRTVQTIKSLGVKAGVAVNPATPLAAVEHVLDQVDLVLIMTVEPGFGGQRFIPGMLPKLRRLTEWCAALPSPPLREVDGGVSPATAPGLLAAGAQILVAGSAVFGAPDRTAAIAALRAT